MFPDYQSLVKQHYMKKKDENALPSGLMYPTPAKLRAECLAAFNKEILKKDRKVLSDFFEESGDDGAIIRKIKNYDVDGFKPLLNYLRGISSSTDPKRIELLAWLTGFEDRPYDHRKNYDSDLQQTATNPPEALDVNQKQAEKQEQAEQIGENNKPEVEVVGEPPQMSAPIVPDKNNTQVNDKKAPSLASPSIGVKQRVNQKAIMATLTVVILAAAGIFMYSGNGGKGLKNSMGSTLNNEEGCMYWAGDHYQQVPCSQKMGDTLVIALDTEKLNSFKKITREDTITKNSKGWVWYIKINNKVEFYTASGNYPLDLTRRLRPITDYIISTYIDTGR